MDTINIDKQTLIKFIHKLNGDLFVISGNAALAQPINSNPKVDQHLSVIIAHANEINQVMSQFRQEYLEDSNKD